MITSRKVELEKTITEINALIEAELSKLMPILGEKTITIVALELDIDPVRLNLAKHNAAPSARPVMRK